jgi:NAD-dependent deacetylase
MGRPQAKPDQLSISSTTRLLVLTGAGVSAESGLATFRDANGLWENHRVEDVATPEAFDRDARLVWRFYSQRRAGAKACAPNAGHAALAELERRLGDRFLLVTQNVDDLHRRAGNERLVELHGNLFFTKCSRCRREPFADEAAYDAQLPACDECGLRGKRALLRPHIVWFGEALDPAHFERIGAFMGDASPGTLQFLAVGTSGMVYPAARLVQLARRHGAETWLFNAEPADNAAAFDHFMKGKSAELLPGLL